MTEIVATVIAVLAPITKVAAIRPNTPMRQREHQNQYGRARTGPYADREDRANRAASRRDAASSPEPDHGMACNARLTWRDRAVSIAAMLIFVMPAT